MSTGVARAIVWLRRDLRVRDNVALFEAAREAGELCLAFVVDPKLLASRRIGAPIVQTFFGALGALREELRACGSDLAVLQGDFAEELIALARRTGARAVYYNEDYEPHALARDAEVGDALRTAGLEARSFTDHVYFGAHEVLTDAGAPYRVFTPYYRRWLDQHRLSPRAPVASERAARAKLMMRESIGETRAVPDPAEFGFAVNEAIAACSEAAASQRLKRFARNAAQCYGRDRDFPALEGTSRLSADLRAGTIGIRTCVASAANEKWRAELAWRDFYQAILRHFPHVATGPFVEAAQRIAWRNDRDEFDAWREGRTGYPIVDAAMLQLARTGWMHNRLRMIVASFLSKDLLIDWRWGERHFERSLADADLASNNGGWQWAASTGTDAVPYFRIFNPVLQAQRFDPDGAFVRSMLPELHRVPDRFVHAPWLAGAGYYHRPIVDRDEARKRALSAYASALGKGKGPA